ncbi:hypothetical protein BU26DRAFT_500174 [Trematosphaeria pertusa]|uniref:Uncharacterized protein n=1 Tax=Trematosphaeria pertusa TaxID=390896 RepID=A0A6A6IVG3_9PLEO|nr:uncharacterized protein BU26DRAFT_500174 [Trematosphaeria pertusa]KAF2254414.1 hypothetical protein BU26DRAFT_500174 [Trematosphaeria pertusa]
MDCIRRRPARTTFGSRIRSFIDIAPARTPRMPGITPRLHGLDHGDRPPIPKIPSRIELAVDSERGAVGARTGKEPEFHTSGPNTAGRTRALDPITYTAARCVASPNQHEMGQQPRAVNSAVRPSQVPSSGLWGRRGTVSGLGESKLAAGASGREAGPAMDGELARAAHPLLGGAVIIDVHV